MQITVTVKDGNLTRGYELDVNDQDEINIINNNTIEVVNSQFIRPFYVLNSSEEVKTLVERTKKRSWSI